MKNELLIRTEASRNEYSDFATLLFDIEENTILKYFLSVNQEEIQITQSMAMNMAAWFDEYNREICKISEV